MSVVCEGFEKQATATGRGLGFDKLPIATLKGHVDSQSYDDMVAAFVKYTVDQIVAGLTTPIAWDDKGNPRTHRTRCRSVGNDRRNSSSVRGQGLVRWFSDYSSDA